MLPESYQSICDTLVPSLPLGLQLIDAQTHPVWDKADRQVNGVEESGISRWDNMCESHHEHTLPWVSHPVSSVIICSFPPHTLDYST